MAALIDEKIFCVHAGLSPEMADIQNVNKAHLSHTSGLLARCACVEGVAGLSVHGCLKGRVGVRDHASEVMDHVPR